MLGLAKGKKGKNALLRKTLLNQKGAMFGLDARIAMAIFALVAAAAGVTFYNTIEQTRASTLTKELAAVEQAYSAYVLDTGKGTSRFTDLTTDTDPGVLGWNGPYLSIIGDDHIHYGHYEIVQGDSKEGTVPERCSPVPAVCFIWVKLTEVPDEIAFSVQEKFDGAHMMNGGRDDNNSGKIRISSQEGETDEIYFRISKR